MTDNSYTMDMTHGPLAGKLLRFALPLMASSMLQLLFNAADVIVVGRFAGNVCLAAVGSTTYLILLITYLFVGLSTGANVIAAQDYGAKKEDEVYQTVHTAMGISILSGLGLMVFGVVMAATMLKWMHTPAEVLKLASVYLRIYFLGMPAMMVYNFGSALLRAAGDTKRPMYFLLLAGIINALLNLLFVISFHWAVAGVGLATIISQYLSAWLSVRCLIRQSDCLRLELRHIHIYRDKLLKILYIGIPAGVEGVIFSVSNVIIQSYINSFHSIIMAGNAASSNIEGFVYAGMNTFYQAVITFTGQNIGAGEYKRADRIFLLCQGMVIATGLILGNLAVGFGTTLLGFYATKSAVIAAGMERLRIICRTYAICGVMDVLAGSMCGMGYAILPTVVSLVGACGLRLLWVVFAFRHTPETWVLYVAYPISWIATVAIHFICYFWVRRQIRRIHQPVSECALETIKK